MSSCSFFSMLKEMVNSKLAVTEKVTTVVAETRLVVAVDVDRLGHRDPAGSDSMVITFSVCM